LTRRPDGVRAVLYHRAMRALAPMIALASSVALVLACTPRLDRSKLEAQIQADMATRGFALTGVTCPSTVLRKGVTFECTALDSNGTRAVFDVTATGNLQGDVTWKLRGRFEDMAVVGDRLEASLASRMGKAVDVTCPSKNIVIQKGVTFECDAKVGGKTMRFVFTAKTDQGDWDTKVQE
jgi:hypothetical protein